MEHDGAHGVGEWRLGDFNGQRARAHCFAEEEPARVNCEGSGSERAVHVDARRLVRDVADQGVFVEEEVDPFGFFACFCGNA